MANCVNFHLHALTFGFRLTSQVSSVSRLGLTRNEPRGLHEQVCTDQTRLLGGKYRNLHGDVNANCKLIQHHFTQYIH